MLNPGGVLPALAVTGDGGLLLIADLAFTVTWVDTVVAAEQGELVTTAR